MGFYLVLCGPKEYLTLEIYKQTSKYVTKSKGLLNLECWL